MCVGNYLLGLLVSLPYLYYEGWYWPTVAYIIIFFCFLDKQLFIMITEKPCHSFGLLSFVAVASFGANYLNVFSVLRGCNFQGCLHVT